MTRFIILQSHTEPTNNPILIPREYLIISPKINRLIELNTTNDETLTISLNVSSFWIERATQYILHHSGTDKNANCLPNVKSNKIKDWTNDLWDAHFIDSIANQDKLADEIQKNNTTYEDEMKIVDSMCHLISDCHSNQTIRSFLDSWPNFQEIYISRFTDQIIGEKVREILERLQKEHKIADRWKTRHEYIHEYVNSHVAEELDIRGLTHLTIAKINTWKYNLPRILVPFVLLEGTRYEKPGLLILLQNFNLTCQRWTNEIGKKRKREDNS